MKFLRFNFLRSRRGLAAIAALLLILFLFRPGAYRLRTRIATSIGNALGRRVVLDNVHLRILPQPGFDLEGLVIYDDPAFSAEPMIRAQQVSAAIRLQSLLRGRLEISTLSATEPSINLVRNNEGRWNLASLIERNAQIPAAPTAKPAFERRPAFPYLEASNARVNFKIGQTKKSYALMDADVALWQDSENSWGARIKAEPVRTDFNLTDTGLLQINATWQRAPNLWTTPLQIAVQWQKGQFGQITKLLTGNDWGWRGGVNFTAKLSGTPEALRIESATAIDGFHRYDIVGSENMRLATGCAGQYNAVTNTFGGLLCESPIGDGTLRLHGNFVAAQLPTYDLTLEAEKVPLTSVVRLLRHAKKQIPGDLAASGLLNAEFHVTRIVPTVPPEVSLDTRRGLSDHLSEIWTGKGSATNVRLSSNVGDSVKNEVAFGTIPLILVSADSHGPLQGSSPGHSRGKEQEQNQEPAEPHLRIGSTTLEVGSSMAANAGGWISTAGYRFFLRGDVDLKDLFRLENILGLPVARPTAEGSAQLDVSVSGPWRGFAPAITAGTAQLRNLRAEIHGLNAPIEIASATMSLTPDTLKIEKISARIRDARWSGAVAAPRHCASASVPFGFAPNIVSTIVPGTVPPCVFQFDLTTDQLSTDDLSEWFTPHPAKRPWYRILNPAEPSGNSALLAVQAHGSLRVGRFRLKKVIATQITTQMDVDRGKVTLTGLRTQLLQGSCWGDWTIDASNHDASNHGESNQPVQYRGTGTVHDISLQQVGTVMNDAWINGTAEGNFDINGSGNSLRDLLTHSDGKLQFVMRNGSLTHIEIPGSLVPLPMHRFAGELHLKQGTWQLSDGNLESRDGIYRVSGTASRDSGFDFVLTRGDEQSWMVTGTLAKPHIEPVSRTEAKRMEADAKSVKP
ncbi:MAG: AsmA family protein [Terriglobales bacterium]